MTTETKQTHSQVLAGEIDKLQSEIPRLKAERDELGRIPILPVGADPGEIAEKISSSVSGNSSRLRGIDSALASLTESLATKRAQLSQAKQQERSVILQQEINQTRTEMSDVCSSINQAGDYIQQQLSKLKALESKLIPLRHQLNPNSGAYPYFVLPAELTVPRANCNTVQTWLEAKPL